MKASYQQQVTVPVWAIYVLLFLTGLGWMTLAYLLGKIYYPPVLMWQVVGEIAKAAFLGTTAGVLIRALLPETRLPHENQQKLRAAGIEAIFLNRREAENTFRQAVLDPNTKKVTISGISLRDFLLQSGILSGTWIVLCERLRDEQRRQLLPADRLEVKILLLDPLSWEGQFRYEIEKSALPQGLRHDVPLGVRAVMNMQEELARQGCGKVLQIKLYTNGAFAFHFVTDSFALVEQYTYRNQESRSSIPLLKYNASSDAYKQLDHSLDIIWENAHVADPNPNLVGVAKGANESRLAGVFRQADRYKLAELQRELLRSAGARDLIDIQAVSAKFYMQTVLEDIERILEQEGKGPKIRVLVINPVSRAAILRAVADGAPLERIGETLRAWTFERHRASRLYNDVWAAIRTVGRLRDARREIEIRLAVSEPSCALLLTPKAVFIEQYLYGRSRNFNTGIVLGGEYAALEYRRNEKDQTTEEKIIESAFEVAWSSYSMSMSNYIGQDAQAEEARFEAEKQELLKQLDPELEDKKIAIRVVVLAAGYGTRMLAHIESIPELRGKPKALLPVGGRPLLDWTVASISTIPEVEDITIITNEYYYAQFDQWRRNAVARKPIKVISDGTKTNEERLGALGDLAFFFRREEIRSAVLVVGGDNFFEGGFEQLINKFSETKKPFVMVHRDPSLQRIAGRLGVVEVDDAHRIIGFEEKPQHPKSPLASTLCYLFTSEEVKLLKAYTREKSQLDNPGEFIRYIVEHNCALYTFECESNWYDIGSPEEYKCANDAAQTLMIS